MKQPAVRGTTIDSRRVQKWLREFSAYRHGVSEERIREWIGRFETADQDLAARILDAVDFYSHEQIASGFRDILNSLEGWHRDETRRSGKWRFVGFSSSAGESGDAMIEKFRHANNLKGRQYNELFIRPSELLQQGLGATDSVVLVDDFVGSGSQACESWNNCFGELLAEVGRVYLVVVAAFVVGKDRIADETDLELVPHVNLRKRECIFDQSCQHFTRSEKRRLLEYCSRVNPAEPKGKGDCGLLVVFAHTCPNNSIPVLHKSNSDWEPIFRRYD